MFVPEKEAASGSLFQTDVRRRTNLSTATNALRSAAAETHDDFLGSSSEKRLAEMEDELNRIVDRDVETLVEGMEEIIDLSSVRYRNIPDYLPTLLLQMCLSDSFFPYRSDLLTSFAHCKIAWRLN
jgi:hypothetical protein